MELYKDIQRAALWKSVKLYGRLNASVFVLSNTMKLERMVRIGNDGSFGSGTLLLCSVEQKVLIIICCGGR